MRRPSRDRSRRGLPGFPSLEVEKYQLRNGLTVVLHEDHKTLLVAVNVTYNVGSKDDPPGRTGFAHLFEHMMFKGSQHSDCAYHWPIHPYVARGYASTGEDLTVYRTTVTCNALETVLWLEADRMGFLLPVLTEEKLVNARNVVRMERRQNWIDPQLSEVDEALSLALYPVGVKASHPTLMLAGRFELQLQANHGRQLEELVQIADAEIERLKKEGPTDQEVRRAKLEAQLADVSARAGYQKSREPSFCSTLEATFCRTRRVDTW